MKNRILVSVTPEEISMALVLDDYLCEYVLERENNEHIVGNIFKGRVKNLLKGIQVAFIDVGREKNVFFYNNEQISINEGQSMLIQVIKDAMGSKGPRAGAQISLAGRYAVFLPDADYIGVSKNIEEESERLRLKEIVERNRLLGNGIIVRTVASGCSEEELKKDINYLSGLWQSIAARAKREEAPALLYREVDLPIRIVRDYLNDSIDELVVDDKETFSRMKELMDFSYPNYKGKMTFYEQKENIFKHYSIDTQISCLNSRKVPLSCGGYLVFDYTEALTVIDVNTGSYKGENNLEDTAFFTNMQAVAEIAKQIRLRDLGGIIIIDFIDMGKTENKKKIVESLEQAMAKDKMKPRVLGITNLGLVEMTRKKTRQNTAATLFAECPVCDGGGYVKSPETVCMEIRRQLRNIKSSKPVLVKAHPLVSDWFVNHEMQNLPRDKKVKVQAVDGMHPEVFTLLNDDL